MDNKTVLASINKGSNNYNRLRIKKGDKILFEGLDTLRVEYNNEFFETEIKNLFTDYGEIDNAKLLEWSNNQHVKVKIDISDIKKGKIKIIKIINIY